MDQPDCNYVDQCIKTYYKHQKKGDKTALTIDVHTIRKKVHHDFLEDLIQYVEKQGFSVYFCHDSKNIIAFPLAI